MMKKILFVCYGNICRSPSAQGIFQKILEDKEINQNFFVDSAGTHNFHIGKPPDSRAIKSAAKHNVDLSNQKCRQFSEKDFDLFDYIFVMDKFNKQCLIENWPHQNHEKIKEFIEFAHDSSLNKVPDPFKGEEQDFDDMMDLLFHLCRNSINELQ